MRVNVCVNGTFRYPDYIRFYAEAGVLGRYHFAHRRGRSAAALGLQPGQMHNVWPKHYLHGAAFHALPGRLRQPLAQRVCDAWQRAVLRRWEPCDSLEIVVGGIADRVVARAKREGTPVLGHPVTTHPATFQARVDAARADLGLAPERRPADHIERCRAEIAACDAFVIDCASVAESFVANGVPAERLALVCPGFDAARFHPRSPDELDRGCFRVVCVGQITPRKAQHVLLRAWRKLNLPDAELLLIGTAGRDGRRMLADCPPNVVHLGHVEQTALRAILARASCFVLPSVEDGSGQAALEAMACGLPVILSDGVGFAELVRPGQSGFVVPALDAEALAAALEALYRDRDRVVAMGREAVLAARAAPGWPDYAAQVLALHKRLASGRPVRDRAAA